MKHAKINATLPKDKDPNSVTLEEAIELIAVKAAAKGGKKSTKKAATAKKTATKKAASKKVTTKKSSDAEILDFSPDVDAAPGKRAAEG